MNMSAIKTKILSLFLSFALVSTMMPINVFAISNEGEPESFSATDVSIVANGDCGANAENVEWTLDSNGVLTISGSGAMADYTWTNFVPSTPWYIYKSSITKIVVEDGVTTIGDSAFYGLRNVNSVDISNDVISFKRYAFSSCRNIQMFDLPSNLEYIGERCFEYCTGLTKIVIPETVTEFGRCVFSGCTSLSDVKLPSNMVILPAGFFSDCESLETIELPSGLKKICHDAFDNCKSLKRIDIPETVISLEGYTFNNCTELVEIIIPNTVETIPNQFCYGCTKLEQITIPESVKYIGSMAFYNCSNLKKVIFPEGLEKVYEKAFFKCTSLEKVLLPKAITSIEPYAFGFYRDAYDKVAVMPNVKLYCPSEGLGVTYAIDNNIPYSIVDVNIPAERCIYTGAEVTPQVDITVDGQALVLGQDYLVEYANNIEMGTAAANITFINDYADIGCIKKLYRIGKLLSECDFTLDEEEYQYHMATPTVTIKDGDYALVYGTDFKVSYTLDEETWTKEKANQFRPLWALGECTITIVGLNKYLGEQEITVDVNKFDLANAILMTQWIARPNGTSSSGTFDLKDFEYDGSAKTQSGYRLCDTDTLDTISDKNYEVTYRDNIMPGTATMVITGIGEYYTGTIEKKFEINHTIHDYETVITKATMSNNGSSKQVCSVCGDIKSSKTIYKIASVKLSEKNYTYNGETQKPSVTVKDSKGNVLENGTDYTVTYASGRKQIGNYKVTVTFKGNYSGKETLYFEIGPKNPSTVKATLYGHDDVKVTWSKVSGVSGYKVYYKKSTADKWTKLTTTTSTSYKKANLEDGVKYYFKVVGYKNVSGNECDNAGKSSSVYTLKRITGVKATKSGSKVKVSWTNISGETGYQISKSTSSSKPNIVATYKTTSGKYQTVSATKGKTYYYKVRAYKVVDGKKIYGPWSTVVKYKRT